MVSAVLDRGGARESWPAVDGRAAASARHTRRSAEAAGAAGEFFAGAGADVFHQQPLDIAQQDGVCGLSGAGAAAAGADAGLG